MPFPKDPIKRVEAIEKIRQKSLAQWQDPEKKAVLMANRVGTTGKKYSLESRAKMSAWQIGRKMTHEDRVKMSIAKKGDDSVYVVGDYSHYSPRARGGHASWAKKIKERDNYTCQLCCNKFPSSELAAHHIQEYTNHPDLRFDLTNGMSLCYEHHKLIHRANSLIT